MPEAPERKAPNATRGHVSLAGLGWQRAQLFLSSVAFSSLSDAS